MRHPGGDAMTLTIWMTRALADRGGAPLGARYAAPRLCLTCGAWTLVGLDDDTLAFQARVDPTPLTPTGELACILAGRPTYDLTRRGARRVLDARDDHALRARPPAAPGARYDVLPAHRCHQPAPVSRRPPRPPGHWPRPGPPTASRSEKEAR